MSNKTIGEMTCPLCRSQKAKVSVSKAGLTVATCHRCHMQLFTRSDISDGALRAQIRPVAEAVQGLLQADAPTQENTPEPKVPESAPFKPAFTW
jgi:hypothetical protein